jgi:hypothetical protein
MQVPTPLKKAIRKLTAPDGKVHKIEFLCDGQQFVVSGTHPDTGQAYRWKDFDLTKIDVTHLPIATEAKVNAFLDRCVEELKAKMGWLDVSNGGSTGLAPNNVVQFTPPIAERVGKMQYGGEFPINDTLLAYSGDQLRNGVPCEDVIKDCLARAQRAHDDIPGDPQERPIWDWNKMRQQIEAMVYGYVKKYHREQPRIIEMLPNSMLEKWRAIEVAGGTPCFQKRRYWGVEDEGPAEPLPEMEPPPSENEEPKDTDAPRRYRFQVIDFEDMRPDDVSHYLVDELLPEKGIGMVWGKPKCLKSFFMLDVCFHIARGMTYHDRAVKRGGVVYCAFEGGYGYKKRVTALRLLHGIDGEPKGSTPLKIVPSSAPNLVKDHTQLVREVREQIGDMAPRIVVLDTLNKSMPGSESKDADMAAYIKAAEAIRDAFDCLVIIVHHCGWDESRPRGHSSLPGAVDVQLRVERTDSHLTIEVELMRDGPEGTQVHLTAEEIVVGRDERAGRDLTSLVLTSLVLKAADAPLEPAEKKRGRPGAAIPVFERALKTALEARGESFQPDLGTPVHAVDQKHVRYYFDRNYIDGSAKDESSLRRAFGRALNELNDNGGIVCQRDSIGRTMIWRPIRDGLR